MYQVDVDVHGPLFDGRARHEVNTALDEAVWEVAKVGRGDLGVQFIKVFREPTGYYESHVEAVHVRPGHAIVHDNGVIYGHWLEGDGSRNYPVTRFAGYWSFRLVTLELARKAHRIAEGVLRRHLARMGG